MLYCIEHQKMAQEFPLKFCPFGHEHNVTIEYEGVTMEEIDYCCFDKGWATCPPPELLIARGRIIRPDEDEIEQLDSVAIELLTEWS